MRQKRERIPVRKPGPAGAGAGCVTDTGWDAGLGMRPEEMTWQEPGAGGRGTSRNEGERHDAAARMAMDGRMTRQDLRDSGAGAQGTAGWDARPGMRPEEMTR